MANSQTAFLPRGQVPNRQVLQDAIKSLRFKLTLDDGYVPFECAGYVPCTLDGEDAGVEIRFAESSAAPACVAHLQAQLGDRDTAISLRWGGDPRERVSALIIGAVLAHDFGALVHRDGEDAFHPSEALIEEARGAFSQLQEY